MRAIPNSSRISNAYQSSYPDTVKHRPACAPGRPGAMNTTQRDLRRGTVKAPSCGAPLRRPRNGLGIAALILGLLALALS